MSTQGPNEHVVNYLRYYCEPANKFDFAVLITGPWGAGKTTLIKRFIDEAKDQAQKEDRPFRPLRVSLYGMISTQEVDDELFRQLHPVLSSKTMKIGWNIVKGSLKAGLKIDLDGKDELKVDSSIPDIDLSKYLKTPSDALLVFDDLERCSMPISDVLGYINSFVEHNSFKTIIIANEAELYAREKLHSRNKSDQETESQIETNIGAKSYTLIKEKLIGQTLEVRSSAEEALKSFLVDIRHDRAKSLLQTQLDAALDIHIRSNTNNLRLLKHALWDYERLAGCLSEEHWSNNHAMESLFKVVLVLAIEVRAGRISRDEFPSLAVSEVVRMMRERDSKDTSVAGRIATQYPMTRVSKSPLNLEQLETMLFEGWLDQADARRSIDNSRYFTSKSEPPWLTAWKGWEVTDEQYLEAISKIENQFRERKFGNNDEMLHIFGLRLFFSEIHAISLPKNIIVEECKNCLDDLMKAELIEERNLRDLLKSDSVYCFDHQVTLADTPEFRTIFARYEQLVEQVKAKRLPVHGEALLEKMKVDPSSFLQLITANNVQAAIYWDTPILAAMSAKKFVDALLSLSPDAQGTVFSALKFRYETGLLRNKLEPECDWLNAVAAELMLVAENSPPLSRFRIRQRVSQNLAPFLRSTDEEKEAEES
ncbi:hypothetical protein BF49_3035 [Bradyrhizobium sp.]|nr:hypothetical protein BF49_3035 [Bradyrhizobium sp.]